MPAEYNVAGVQFAFRYVHPNEDTTGQLAIDNVKLMAVETGEAAQKYTITATVQNKVNRFFMAITCNIQS